MAKPQTLIIAPLGTQDDKALYVRQVLRGQGFAALIIDCGSLGAHPPVTG